MSLREKLAVRLRRWWNPDRLAADIDEEMRFHIDMEARDLMRRGVPPREARRRAERDFGSFVRFKDEARRAGALPRLESLLVDIRYAFRQLRRSPGFAAVAVLTLAIGVGGNTAIFSLVNTVLLRSLPYEQAEELVAIKEYVTERGVPEPGSRWGASYPNFDDWRDAAGRPDIFEDMAASASAGFLLTGGDEPREVRGGLLTANYFELLGVSAALGRTLEPGPADVLGRAVVLSDGLWREAYGGDPEVVGRSIRLGDEPHVVVGVMPPWFGADGLARFWIRLADDNHPYLQERGLRAYGVVARLAEGVTAAQAQAAMTSVHAALAEAHPDDNAAWSVQVIGLYDDIVGPVRQTLLLLQFAVATLLLLACANVANLLMARATGRRQETALRAALGAGRARLAQQHIIESTVLALAGGAVGVLLAAWATRTIVALTPTDIPRLEEPQGAAAVFAFSFGVAVLCGLVFGLAPFAQRGGAAWAAARRISTSAHAGGRGARRLRDLLVVLEVALSLVLLVAAGLLISSFAYLWGYEAGFDAERVLTMTITDHDDDNPSPAQLADSYERLYTRLRQIPQVEAVGGITRLPLGSGNIEAGVEAEGSVRAEPATLVNLRPVSGDYFDVMRIPVLAGRTFADGDSDALVINRLAARELWPETSPVDAVGRRVRFTLREGVAPWRTVIGVVGDTRHGGLDPEPRPEVYERHAMRSFGVNVVVMRTRVEPHDVAGSARAALHSVDPQQPIADLRSMQQVIDDSMRQPRFYAVLFTTFGALALLIAAAGVFATAAFSTGRRTREIGVRMAVGARRGDLVRMIVWEGARLVAAGMAFGLVVSLALGRYVSGLLYGVTANDPVTIAAAATLLAAASLMGFWLPARRATRIDPTEALRLD